MTAIIFFRDGRLVVMDQIKKVEADEYEVVVNNRVIGHPSDVLRIELMQR